MTTTDDDAPKPKTIGEMSRNATWSRTGWEIPKSPAEAEAQLAETDARLFEHVVSLAEKDPRFAPLVLLARTDPGLAVRISGATVGSAYEARRIARDYPEHSWILDECRKAIEPMLNASRWARSSIYMIFTAHDLLRSEVADAAFDATKTPESERTNEARDALANEIATWVHGHLDALGFGEGFLMPPPDEDGLLLHDVRFAAELERFDGMKPHVTKLREASSKRARAYEEGSNSGKLYELWLDPAAIGGAKYLKLLARALWRNVVQPRRKRESTASPIEIRESLGYTKLPKVAAGASWAFGADGLTGVELDGDRYGFEPNLAREIAEGRAYVPKSMALLPREYAKRPHQESLALAFDPADEDADPIPVALSNTLIGTIEAKLMLLAMADHNVRSGHLAMASVDEWTARLFPNANRIQARDRARTVGAFWNAKSTCIYNPAQGNAPSIFDVSPAVRRLRDGEIDPSAEIWIGYAKGFEQAIANYFGQGRYAGDFLINLTGAMELDNRHPAQLRYYVRSAATWNASFDPRSGAYRPDMVPTYEIDRWAAMNNALPPSAVDYLNQTPDGRRKLANKRKEASKAREQTRADLEALQAKGLIRLETVGRTKIRILPPEAYSNARNLARKAGLRPERKE